MGKSTISMAIFNSYVKLPEGTSYIFRINPLIPKNDKQDMIDAFEWLCMSPTSSVKFWKTHKKRDKHPVSSSSRRRAPLCLRVSQLHQQAMFVVILLPEAPTRLTGRPLGLRMEKG
jgi:hypothetical protein